MKKIILFAAILFSTASVVNAQTVTSDEGSAKLTINLNAIQSITVSGDVVIDYTTANDYANGKESDQVTTLSVVSAGGFAIRVEAENLKNGTSELKSENIKVTATGDATNTTFDANGTLVKSAAKKALIASTKGGVNKQYTVKYKGDGGNEYMENYNAGGTQSYVTTVTYTIAAQ